MYVESNMGTYNIICKIGAAKLLQSWVTLCNPMDSPGFSVHEILHGQQYWSELPLPFPGNILLFNVSYFKTCLY